MVIAGEMFRNISLYLHTLTCNQNCYTNFEKIYTSLFSINFVLVLFLLAQDITLDSAASSS